MKRLLSHLVAPLLGIMLLFTSSCKKNDQQSEKTDLISETRVYFEREVLSKPIPENVTEPDRHYISKRPDWEKAIIKQLKFGQTVIVPVVPEGNKLYATTDGGKTKIPAQDDIYLILYKDNNHKIHSEVVFRSPAPGAQTSSKFTGSLRVESWDGKILKSYNYKEGKAYKNQTTFSYKQSPRTEASLCTTTDFYYCVYAGDSETCSYSYSKTDCIIIGSGGTLEESDNPDGSSSGGGGYDDAYTATMEDSYRFTCPDNFAFTSITTNNVWQEAALTNVSCRMNYIDRYSTTTRFVKIPILYFGLPYYSGSTVLYTNRSAQQIAADALNFAEYNTREYFSKNPDATEVELQDYWIKEADRLIKLDTKGQGKVTKSGSINPVKPVVAKPYSAC